MEQVITIGLDIAKHVFHARGADSTGRAVFSRKLTRGKLLDFFQAHPRCLVTLSSWRRDRPGPNRRSTRLRRRSYTTRWDTTTITPEVDRLH
jgi:transposase